MAYEHKENTAGVFQNRNKESGDKRPDFTGRGNVNGEIMEFAMWERETKEGKPMFSITFKTPQEKYQKPNTDKSPF